MNAKQILNKLADELPSKFVVSINSKYTKYSDVSTKHRKAIYIGVYDEKGIYYEELSRHMDGETWGGSSREVRRICGGAKMEIDREALESIAERAAERVLMECPSLDVANDYVVAMTIFRQAKNIMVETFEEHLVRLEKGYNRALQGRQVQYDTGQLADGTGGAPEGHKPSHTEATFRPDEKSGF